jgi:uncharacterized protein (DUF302 family)
MFRLVFLLGLTGGAALAEEVRIPTDLSVGEAMDRIETAARDAGATVFARVDHAAGAAEAEMDLAPAEVLIFGNPALGTPLMQQEIGAALALPLRIAVYERETGEVVIAYETVPTMLEGLDVDLTTEGIASMEAALQAFAAEGAGL